MHLLYVGLTHRETPLTILEKAHFSDQEGLKALKLLKREKSILENIILSTCNRTELYLVVDQLHTGRYYSKHFLADWFQIPVKELEEYLVFREGDEALRHLLRVSIGLESKIVGESQVLGQLKQALTFAKRMHDTYRINDRPISIGLTAIQELDRLGLDYSTKKVAVIGLGVIGQLVTKYALQRPFESVMLLNRTVSKAQPFLTEDRVSAHGWDELEAVLADADVVFSAVKTEEYIIFPSMLKEGAIVFDLCLPRSCYPSSSLKLYNIENLTNQLEQYKAERQEIAGRIALEIDEELVKFADWRQQLGIIPLIQEIRDKALEAQASAMESLNRKIPDLTEREQKQISKHMKSIINQVLKEPILQLKELSVGEHSDYDIALIAKIFGLHRERGKDEGH